MANINKKDQVLLNDKTKNFLNVSTNTYTRKADFVDTSFHSKNLKADDIEKQRSSGLGINQKDQCFLNDKSKCFMNVDVGYSYGDDDDFEVANLGDSNYDYKQTADDMMKVRNSMK
jgi:hypothetical protein